jgi:hypothetical protein
LKQYATEDRCNLDDNIEGRENRSMPSKKPAKKAAKKTAKKK